MYNRKAELAQGFRDLADLIEQLEDDLIPLQPCVNIFARDKEQMAAFARLASPVEKDAAGESWFYLRKRFAGELTLECNIARDKVCERVQTGTRIVEARPEQTLPATEAKEEPIYEWKCSSILAEVE